MKSIREIYRIGNGPSSSHSMAPRFAAQIFLEKHPDANAFQVVLYGSLAATGKGHGTDVSILAVLKKKGSVEIIWKPDIFLPFHPNGMTFRTIDKDKKITDEWTVYSIGGGTLAEEKKKYIEDADIYKMTRLKDILLWCSNTGKNYWEYVEKSEGIEIWDYLAEVWEKMKASILQGLMTEGVLPGMLHLRRKASSFYIKSMGYRDTYKARGSVFAYALAASEENAAGHIIVTAPTCGSCGVLPAVLFYLQKTRNFSDIRIYRALATAGLIGNIVKENASVSGAEVGCQGEIGVACAMASAASCQLFGNSITQVEYAAEMGLEHHLGMTCDPIGGLVQIPCIERNAYAAARALDINVYASFTDGNHYVSFDRVVEVMKKTGHDIPSLYKETSEGGLAKEFSCRKCKL